MASDSGIVFMRVFLFLMLCISLHSLSATAQNINTPTTAKSPVSAEPTGEYLRGEQFSLDKGLQVYNASAEADHRPPAHLSPEIVKAVEDYFKSSDAFTIVDQTIVDSAYRVGGAISTLNGEKTKDPVISLMISQELVPELFRHYQWFKALYGDTLADTLTLDEMRSYTAYNLRKQPPLDEAIQKKFREASRRFQLASNKLVEMVFFQMTRQQKSQLDPYGLNLDFNSSAAKQVTGKQK